MYSQSMYSHQANRKYISATSLAADAALGIYTRCLETPGAYLGGDVLELAVDGGPLQVAAVQSPVHPFSRVVVLQPDRSGGLTFTWRHARQCLERVGL